MGAQDFIVCIAISCFGFLSADYLPPPPPSRKTPHRLCGNSFTNALCCIIACLGILTLTDSFCYRQRNVCSSLSQAWGAKNSFFLVVL